MKRTLLTAVAAFGLVQSMNAQVIDTLITGPGYGNNIWYSLENDNQKVEPSNNWHIALASAASQTSQLSASILFNYKMGSVYAVAGSNPADFASFNLTQTELDALTPLYNSDTTWKDGAFNNTPAVGQYDYGWGGYDMVSHNVIANRIFVIKSGTAYYKVIIDLMSVEGKYIVKHAELASSTPIVTEVPLTPYNTKNFVYLSFSSTAAEIKDREPASASWDLVTLQYQTEAAPNTMYPVAGIFHNHGVKVAKAYPVNSPATYTNWSAQTFSPKINTIGYTWKNAQAGTVEDSTVYFVKTKGGDLWKIIFTKFISGSGTGTGEYIFSKQKLETASVGELEANVFMTVYPNPANESVTLVLDSKSASSIAVYNTLGSLVYSTEVSGSGLQTVNLPVADLNSGIYHVVCTSNGATATQKLMVQH